MGKSTRGITVDSEVNDSIIKKIREEGFNCSEWFNSAFKREFMCVEEKEKLIKEHEIKIENLKKEISEVKTRKKVYSNNLSRAETRFLKSVPLREKEEKLSRKSLLGGFNISFHKDWDLEKFNKTVRLLSVKTK